jgi:hypothetical protein
MVWILLRLSGCASRIRREIKGFNRAFGFHQAWQLAEAESMYQGMLNYEAFGLQQKVNATSYGANQTDQ